jgi:putative NADPH-quinone reductase
MSESLADAGGVKALVVVGHPDPDSFNHALALRVARVC